MKALKIMKTTPMDEGIRQYGPDFRNYDFVLRKHAASTADLHCDQGHVFPGPTYTRLCTCLCTRLYASLRTCSLC